MNFKTLSAAAKFKKNGNESSKSAEPLPDKASIRKSFLLLPKQVY